MKSHLDQRRAEEINVQLLKRKDPAFSHILHTSLRAVLFKYDGAWRRAEVDGPIYLYRRQDIPSVALLLLNRKSPNDFLLFIDMSVVEVGAEEQLVVIKRARRQEMEVFGVWFYETHAAVQASYILADQLDHLERSKGLLQVIQKQQKARRPA